MNHATAYHRQTSTVRTISEQESGQEQRLEHNIIITPHCTSKLSVYITGLLKREPIQPDRQQQNVSMQRVTGAKRRHTFKTASFNAAPMFLLSSESTNVGM